MKNTRIISFSGKGGSGKTTTTSLFLSAILRCGLFEDILVIDSDPDANLAETLNVSVQKTVGQVLDKRKMELDEAIYGTKLRFSLWESISQGEGFDLLVMGRSTGEGCYCSVNTMLNYILEDTLSMYDIVLIDFDAGLEHFSRRAGNPTDTLIITCDPSRLSFDTAKRIRNLIEELSLPYERRFLVGCRFNLEQKDLFSRMARETGIGTLGMIPYDDTVASNNLLGKGLLSLDDDNRALKSAINLFDKVVSRRRQ